jgi:membrane protease YdiL (CAAX protease family)
LSRLTIFEEEGQVVKMLLDDFDLAAEESDGQLSGGAEAEIERLQARYPVIVWNLAISIIMTWLYNRTHGSILAPALFHLAMNTFGNQFSVNITS